MLLELIAKHVEMYRGPSFLRDLVLHVHINPFCLVNVQVVPQKVMWHTSNGSAQ